MYVCEQCGSSFSPIRISSPGACPRCLVRDRVRVPLVFSPFFGSPDPSQSARGEIESGPPDEGDSNPDDSS